MNDQNKLKDDSTPPVFNLTQDQENRLKNIRFDDFTRWTIKIILRLPVIRGIREHGYLYCHYEIYQVEIRHLQPRTCKVGKSTEHPVNYGPDKNTGRVCEQIRHRHSHGVLDDNSVSQWHYWDTKYKSFFEKVVLKTE